MQTSARTGTIEAARLRLVALLPEEIEALIDDDTALVSKLAMAIFPAGWPTDVDAREGLQWHLQHLRADPAQRAWRIRVIVERDTNSVVGSVNMKGPPTAGGDVEVGWGVNPDRRRRGYAFEAASAVMHWAARQPGVRQFSATIPHDNVASQAVARKLGMKFRGELRRELPLWTCVAAHGRIAGTQEERP